jgi:hypothetical protein
MPGGDPRPTSLEPDGDIPNVALAGALVARGLRAFAILFAAHLVARVGLGARSTALQLAALLPLSAYTWGFMFGQGLLVPLRPLMSKGELRTAAPLFLEAIPLYLLVATESFAAWTAFFFERGWVNSASALTRGHVLGVAERFYAWNLADTIPTLQLPRTLHWAVGPGFNDLLSGSLLLTYKVVVIIPIILAVLPLLRAVLAEPTQPDSEPRGD